jgi:hypothetical protein
VSERVTRSRRDWMNAVALSFFPMAAALALVLSLPRLVEGLLALPGNAAIEDIQTGAGSEAFDTLIRSRERTVGWIDRGKYHSQLSWALALDPAISDPDERRRALDRAFAEARLGVSQAPADAFAWHHLAQASFARDGANQMALDAEFSSIAIGPYETELMIPRLDLLFAARSYLGRKFDDTIDDQIRIAWRRDEGGLIRIIRRNGTADIARRALGREPSILPLNFDDRLKDPNFH